MIGFRCGSKCGAFLVGLAIVLVAWVAIQRACSRPPDGMPRVTVVEPVKRYDPNTRYEIQPSPRWRPTGETIDDVPVVEPADKRTREKVKRVFGEEADKVDFLYVGEIDPVGRGGADVYLYRDKVPETIPVPDGGTAVDLSGLPRGVPKSELLRFELVARPDPRFDWRDPHRIEVSYGARFEDQFEDQFEQEWRLTYRPAELWIKGRVYLFLEGGVYQQRGDVVDTGIDLFARSGAAVCIKKKEC